MMDGRAERLNKAREERIAREQARILKLRELNRKKYDIPVKTSAAVNNVTVTTNISKSQEQHMRIQSNKKMYGIKYTKNRQSSVYPVNFTTRPQTYEPPVDSNVANNLYHVSSRLSNYMPRRQCDNADEKQTERKHFTSPNKSKYVINSNESVFTRLYRHALHKNKTIATQTNNNINTNNNKNTKTHFNNKQSDHNITKPVRSISAMPSDRSTRAELTLERHTAVAECINSSRKVEHGNELQTRLTQWLNNRGKSLSAYHHLKCFGAQHLPATALDDENKENIPQDIADDDSYTDNLQDRNNDFREWRRVSVGSESEDGPMTPAVSGALADIHNLLCEGYSGTECKGWLRALRRKYPAITDTQLYWRCCELITQLPENNSDIPELSLEPLLSTFQKLQISSNTDKNTDNAHQFNSTLIKIATLQTPRKKLTEYTLTPVRRSSRLSVKPETRTRLADISAHDHVNFVVNKALHYSP